MRRPARVLAMLVPVVLLAAACASLAPASTTAPSEGGSGPFPVRGGDIASQVDVDGKGSPGSIPAPEFATNPSVAAATSRNLILTAQVVMKTQDPWATADKARAIASGLGGDIRAMSQTGQGQ